jgi:hypothetical protein
VATLRNTYTAVIARGERWAGQVYTEPYEAAWASEAVFFIHLMPDSTPPSETAVARVQISPDGLHWVNEGTEFELPTVPDAVSFGRVLNFGGWLRLAVAVPNACVFKVVATLSLKA